jgi:putative DNA primase/helicase
VGSAPAIASPAPRQTRQKAAHAPDDGEGSDTQEYAADIWRASVAIEGTPGEVHLRKTRRLDIPEGTSGRVLRYHGACPFFRVENKKKIHFKVPALVCLFRDIHTDEPTAIHRIAITLDGRKAGLSPAKLSLGPKDGAAVKLSPHDAVEYGLTIGEGVETTLAGMMEGFKPAWALCSSGAIKNFPVLSGIETQRRDGAQG